MMIQKIKSSSSKQLLWIIPLFIVLSPFFIIGAPFIYLGQLYQNHKAKKFLSKNLGKSFFFYKNKGGWSDFIKNNVIPTLPPDTIVYNITRDKDHPLEVMYKIFLLFKMPLNGKLPFLITLDSPTPRAISLKEEFAVAKRNPKRNEEIQLEIKKTLSDNYA